MMKDDVILLSHGAGGKKSAELTKNLFMRYFKNNILENLGDSAILDNPGGKIAFTTDSFRCSANNISRRRYRQTGSMRHSERPDRGRSKTRCIECGIHA